MGPCCPLVCTRGVCARVCGGEGGLPLEADEPLVRHLVTAVDAQVQHLTRASTNTRTRTQETHARSHEGGSTHARTLARSHTVVGRREETARMSVCAEMRESLGGVSLPCRGVCRSTRASTRRTAAEMRESLGGVCGGPSTRRTAAHLPRGAARGANRGARPRIEARDSPVREARIEAHVGSGGRRPSQTHAICECALPGGDGGEGRTGRGSTYA